MPCWCSLVHAACCPVLMASARNREQPLVAAFQFVVRYASCCNRTKNVTAAGPLGPPNTKNCGTMKVGAILQASAEWQHCSIIKHRRSGGTAQSYVHPAGVYNREQVPLNSSTATIALLAACEMMRSAQKKPQLLEDWSRCATQ